MEIFLCLFLYCFNNFRVGISDIQNTNTSDPVKEFVSVKILKHCTCTLFDTNWISFAAKCFRDYRISPVKKFF